MNEREADSRQLSLRELFMRLGSTPATRSARAESLFRRLRDEDSRDAIKSLMSSPSQMALKAGAAKRGE